MNVNMRKTHLLMICKISGFAIGMETRGSVSIDSFLPYYFFTILHFME